MRTKAEFASRLLEEYGFSTNGVPESICPHYGEDCEEPFCQVGDCEHPEFLLLMDLIEIVKDEV